MLLYQFPADIQRKSLNAADRICETFLLGPDRREAVAVIIAHAVLDARDVAPSDPTARLHALGHAMKLAGLGGSSDPTHIVSAAKAFEAYLLGNPA